MKLSGENVYLRAIEPSDIDVVFKWENDTDNWMISNTQAPFSRFVLEQYISTSHQDIYSAKQLRLMICNNDDKVVGTIDLFDFDANHLRAGIGILIADKEDRRKGYASEAIQLVTEYCFEALNLNQVYCNIAADNEVSVAMFVKLGYKIVGVKQQWLRDGRAFKDELLLQNLRN